MNKKCIAVILIQLVLIHSLGCSSSRTLSKNNIEEIKEGDEITVIDQDMKAYNITVQSCDINGIKGTEYTGERSSVVVISSDQIARIEMRRMDYGIMVMIGGIFLGAIIFDGIAFPLPRPN
jgi:hypothetical protein